MKIFRLLITTAFAIVASASFAATSDTLDLTFGSGTTPSTTDLGKIVRRGPIDINFATYAAASTTVTASQYVSIAKIPAKSSVIGISVEVLTAEGSTCTVAIGTSTAGQGSYWSSSVNLNSVAWNWLPASSISGKTYSSLTTLRMTTANTTAKAKVRIYVWYMPNP